MSQRIVTDHLPVKCPHRFHSDGRGRRTTIVAAHYAATHYAREDLVGLHDPTVQQAWELACGHVLSTSRWRLIQRFGRAWFRHVDPWTGES